MKYKLILLSYLSLLISATLLAQEDYDQVEGASAVEVYKTIDTTELRLWIFNPSKIENSEPLPAIIFFYGGGWAGGTPKQFVEHSKYLANRGMIAIVADYRVKNRHGILASKCVADAKSAIRYLRKNASRLQIAPNQIISAGGSAGGHLAASTAVIKQYNDPQDDLSISSTPNAAVLFNPVMVTANIEGKFELNEGFSATLKDRIGVPLESLSPFHQLNGRVPPILIFHGTDDKTVPYLTAELFHNKLNQLGGSSTLYSYEGEGHGFFNFGRKDNAPFINTVKKMDDFLVSLGYLSSVPGIKVENN